MEVFLRDHPHEDNICEKQKPEGIEKNITIVLKTADPVAAGKRQEANSRSAVDHGFQRGGSRLIYTCVGVPQNRSFNLPTIDSPLQAQNDHDEERHTIAQKYMITP